MPRPLVEQTKKARESIEHLRLNAEAVEVSTPGADEYVEEFEQRPKVRGKQLSCGRISTYRTGCVALR